MEIERPIATLKATGEGLSFSREERERHVYIVGKSGSGKTTTLFNLAMSDIVAGQGVAIIDPHGDLAEAVADCIPRERTNEVCYFNVADTDQPVGFNPIAGIRPERQALAAAGIVSAFKALWGDSWGSRTEHLLHHGVASLIEAGRSTLIDLPRLYTDDAFRSRIIGRVRDPITRRFWADEFAGYDQRFRTEAVAPILNKAGQFAASPNVRLIFGQVAPKFDLAHAMNHRQIVIANLARGRSASRRRTSSAPCLFRISSSPRWSAPRSPSKLACRSLPISTSFSHSARTASRRCCRRRANSARIFAWRTSTPHSSRRPCERLFSEMPDR